ncbi:cytochrome P450 [Streptomyces mirabilis]|uniref:cytochrome P450 n=1 Tax=Streptomyces TaxID=1883 RepID=UPI0029A44CD7|nr:cytochrome P450 [Streptomyces sp. AK02-04a]MDX3761016.1 cytochrome P450 [Streptomyces sp. AK02-04a]
MLTSSFTRHRMEKLRPAIQQITDDLIDKLLARRAVVEDIEIDGETIRAGEGFIAALPAANWDPLAFPEPEKLDLARRAAHHVAFSRGPHQCIGQQLARIELHIVFSTLFRRVPTLRLAVDVSELKFKEDSQAYGIYELPVTWELLEVREAADTTRPSPHRREDGLRPAVKLVGTTGFEPATP